MRWAGHVACMGTGEVRIVFWWGKPEGKKPLGRPRRRWKYNIKMNIQDVGCGDMDWISVALDRDG